MGQARGLLTGRIRETHLYDALGLSVGDPDLMIAFGGLW